MSAPTSRESVGSIPGIAIVGMAGMFPGAKNIDQFWDNLKNGIESVSFFSDRELLDTGVDPGLLSNPDYVKASAILDDIDRFDAAFFGFNRRDAELMDPQQRLFLECAYTALDHAGYTSETYAGLIGVYAGVGPNTYLHHILSHPELVRTPGLYHIGLGNEKDFLATRLAYALNLKGPSTTVQSACSTSLVAIHLACQSLLNFECDLMLAGAASVRANQQAGYLYQTGSIYARDGHCRAFDARATGTIAGSGVGVVVLKRLADALADGDCIHAIIRSSAINNDGARKVGFTAPSQDGQAAVIAEAISLAGVDPETIGYIETHGTGTILGDPIEVAALNQAFRRSTARRHACAIGSVKTNIGHLDAAAGIAGLIKTVLALKHRHIPATLNFEQPNPQIDFADGLFYVNTTLTAWPRREHPRRAGINSFGIGGTNAHLILEEAPAVERPPTSRAAHLLPLSAKTPTALEAAVRNLAEYLSQHPQIDPADVASTLQVGRRAFSHRTMLVCRDTREAIEVLQRRDPQRLLSRIAEERQRSVAFLFPGQGAHYPAMMRELYRAEPIFRSSVDRCAELLKRHLGLDLRDVLYPSAAHAAASAQLSQTSIAQPALFVVEYALAQLWQAWGIVPQAMLGHSLGEYVAACIAGVFSLEDALMLVAVRGCLMQNLPRGAMLALPLAESEVRPLLHRVSMSDGRHLSLAATNGPTTCVVAGSEDAVTALARQLKERGIESQPVSVSHAFHSSMMEPMVEPFLATMRQVPLHPPQIPYISNITGTWITAAEATDPTYWARHLHQTVRCAEGMRMLCQREHQVLLEVGPGHTLASLARRHPARSDDQIVLTSIGKPGVEHADTTAILRTLGQLWLAGIAVNWTGLHAEAGHRRVPLPTYPFERERYWISAAHHGHPSVLDRQPSMSAVQRTAQPAPTRRAAILATLGMVINRLTGVDPDALDMHQAWFDAGVDSLLLIQLNQAIHDTWGIRLSLAQLLEDYPTLDRVADYIDQMVPRPEDQPAVRSDSTPPTAPQPAPAYEAAVGGAVAALHAAAPDADSALERVISQQLHLMAQQLDMLKHLHTTGIQATHDRVLPSGAPPAPPAAPQSGSRTTAPAPFVPHQPLMPHSRLQFTEQQQRYLADFVARYTRRTRRSKDLAQHYRPVLADSRWTAAFRLAWKELVYPITGERSAGARLWDVDGNEYVDFTMGFGVHLFGHAPPFIIAALEEQLRSGVPLGPQSPLAGEVAHLIRALTGAERVAFCNSGTEAVMGALRIARTATRRTKVACFAGSYHGWADGTLARQTTTDGHLPAIPSAPGVPPHAVEDLLVLPYDHPDALDTIRAHAHELAAVLVEPVQSRRLDLQPAAFLRALRALTEQAGIALIFDEMVTGFRIHPGGAQAWFGIRADIVTYGKIVGGGLPIGVIGGKAAYMDAVDGGMWSYGDDSYPQAEKTMFAGAFFKHPLTMASALAVLKHITAQGPALQEALNRRTAALVATLNRFFQAEHVPLHVVHFGSVFRFTMPDAAHHLELFRYHLTHQGIHTWEGGNFFLSTAHSDAESEHLIRSVKDTIADLRRGGFLSEVPPKAGAGVERSIPIDRHDAAMPAAALRSVSGAHLSALPEARRVRARSGAGAATAAEQTRCRDLEFSLYYFGNYPAAFDPKKYDLLFQGADFADDHGFAAVWIPERHFHSFGGFSPNPSVIAAALARATERIHIRAGSVALPLHHPIRVAEEWSVVDNISKGRVGIAFAPGWHPDDFVFAPEKYHRRRDVMLEGIEIVRQLWRGESIAVQGGAQSRLAARLYPMPWQAELPIWLACAQPETFVTAGALGAGVLVNLIGQSIEALAENIRLYRQSLARHGIDPASGHVTALIHTYLADDHAAAIETARQPLYSYLNASLGLNHRASGQGRQIDMERIPDVEHAYLLEQAALRIARGGTLIGTVRSCLPVVEQLSASGVTEIACLIDFGIDSSLVLESLGHLSVLRAEAARRASAVQPDDQDRPTHRVRASAPQAAGATGADTSTEMLTFPLTESQQALWAAAQIAGSDASVYNEPLALRLSGPLDVKAMQAAIQQVVDRHESLRTTVSHEGAYQRVAPVLRVDLPLIDLSMLERRQREEQATTLIDRHARQPFDLEAGPLCRFLLVKLHEHEHLLLTTLHHIITDSWSGAIIFNEISACYWAACQGQIAELPTPLQFRDYVQWRSSLGHEVAQAEVYWLQRFADTIPILELPTDHPRPSLPTFHGARTVIAIDRVLSRQIKEAAKQQGCSLLMILLAAWSLVLHRVSGQHDLIVGVPAAGQLRMRNTYVTGYCVNLLPIRSTIEAGLPGRAYLSRVRRTVLDAYDNQHGPFSRLLTQIGTGQHDRRSARIRAVFNLETGGRAIELYNLRVQPVTHVHGAARFDLSLQVIEADDHLDLQCEYNTDLFDAQTIHRWLTYLQTLLAGLVHDPDVDVSRVPLVPEAQRQDRLVARDTPEATAAANQCLHQLCAEQARRTPDATAVIFGEQCLTYHELDRRANQLAHHLRSLGVRPESRVGLCLDRSLELLIGLLGVLKAGAAYVPLDPAYPPDRLADMAEDAHIAVLLTADRRHTHLPETTARIVCLDVDWPQIEAQPTTSVICRADPDNLAYIMYTSGSTGRPKGVQMSHRAIVNRLCWMQDAYRLDASDRVLQKTPCSFDVSVWEFFWPLLSGATLVVAKPGGHQDPAYLVELMTRERITTLHFVPSMLQVLLDEPDLDRCTSLRRVICSGEPLPLALQQRFFTKLHAELHNLYGPTEAAIDVTAWACGRDTGLSTVPIGRPIANTEIYLLDRDLRPVPVGGYGELYIGGVQLARGYHGRPDLTAERFVPHPFSRKPGTRLYRTGDLARYLPDGVLAFLGRIDDQVKIRGQRIEPGEVAEVLARHPGVREVAVVARQAESDDTRLVAYVVREPGTKHRAPSTRARRDAGDQGLDLSSIELRSFLKDRLPASMIPAALVFLERMPRTPHGKIDRQALPVPDPDRPDLDVEFVLPRTPIEEQLARIWCEFLSLNQVGVFDDFFDLGGDSIVAARLISRLRRVFRITLSVQAFVARPTIADLVALMGKS
ncbi:MAG TPA: amino acid adenylation domain-containing protein [Herpetosiphonaceae bacterium]